MDLRHSTIRLIRGLALFIVLSLSVGALMAGWGMHYYGVRVLGVQTGSMEPALNVGDGLVIRKVDFNSLAVGDIVSYKPHGAAVLVSHRIVGIKQSNRQLVVKGDNNAQADGESINASQIVGRAEATMPHIGRVNNLLHTSVAIIVLVYLPAISLIVYESVRLKGAFVKPYRLAGYPKH